MLANLKLLLGISDTSKDALLTLLLSNAEEEAKSYTHNSTTTGYESAIIQMAIYKYNLLGAEGLQSETYTGAGYTYITDYPEPIVRLLKSHKKAIFV